MDRRRSFVWSAVGAVLWAIGLTLLGYWLGGVPLIRDNIKVAVLLIVVLSLLPPALEYLRRKASAHS